MVTQQTLKMFGGYYASDLVGKVIFTLFLWDWLILIQF
jgi:hypothetical protein